MNKYIILFFFVFTYNIYASKNENPQMALLKNKLEKIENDIKEVRRDELNYTIEKNLLKETYSNNYENISQIITLVLGIIGLFGYLGLRDINSIKKEYTSELSKLSDLKSELETKINSISNTQIKYEKEISEIIKQNEEQNKQIQLLEYQSKIKALRSDKKYPAALENCVLALNIDPNNLSILLQKALIYVATLSYSEGITTYKKILKIDPSNEDAFMNLAEAYIFKKEYDKTQEIIETYPENYKSINGQESQSLFKALNYFNLNDKIALISEVKSQINSKPLNRKAGFESWGVEEAYTFVEHCNKNNCTSIIETYLDYVDGKITGKEALEKLG